jgi:hypothetical protein
MEAEAAPLDHEQQPEDQPNKDDSNPDQLVTVTIPASALGLLHDHKVPVTVVDTAPQRAAPHSLGSLVPVLHLKSACAQHPVAPAAHAPQGLAQGLPQGSLPGAPPEGQGQGQGQGTSASQPEASLGLDLAETGTTFFKAHRIELEAKYAYVEAITDIDLLHAVKLISAGNSSAFPFQQGMNPKEDLRWLFVGFSGVPGSRLRLASVSNHQL